MALGALCVPSARIRAVLAARRLYTIYATLYVFSDMTWVGKVPPASRATQPRAVRPAGLKLNRRGSPAVILRTHFTAPSNRPAQIPLSYPNSHIQRPIQNAPATRRQLRRSVCVCDVEAQHDDARTARIVWFVLRTQRAASTDRPPAFISYIYKHFKAHPAALRCGYDKKGSLNRSRDRERQNHAVFLGARAVP